MGKCKNCKNSTLIEYTMFSSKDRKAGWTMAWCSKKHAYVKEISEEDCFEHGFFGPACKYCIEKNLILDIDSTGSSQVQCLNCHASGPRDPDKQKAIDFWFGFGKK